MKPSLAISGRTISSLLTGRYASRVVTTLMFFLCLFLTRLPQLSALSNFLGPTVLIGVLFVVDFSDKIFRLNMIIYFIFISAIIGIVLGANEIDAARFSFILLGTLIVFFSYDIKGNLPFILSPIAAQALFVISISIVLTLAHDKELASIVRTYALEARWGDIYSQDGYYYRVQLVGNALLPLFFMVSTFYFKNGLIYRIYWVLGLLAVIAAGNLTYIVTMTLFIFYLIYKTKLITKKRKSIIILVSFLFFCVFGFEPLKESIALKVGSQSSIGVRVDQLNALTTSIANAPITLIFGHGLGRRFPNGKVGDYSNSLYIELQILYIFYQIGLLGIILYAVKIWEMAKHRFSKEGIAVFLFFILAGISNPYILDSNQIVATLIILLAFGKSVSRGEN